MAPEKFVRPEVLSGRTYKVRTGCGSLYVTINDHPETGNPIEIFLRLGKAGGCASATAETTGRLTSQLLQLGQTAHDVVKQLAGVSCHSSSKDRPSCVDMLARQLKELAESKP